MTPGDPAVKNAWGSIVDAAWPCLEQLAGGNGPISLTGLTTCTLSVANNAADQARQAMLAFTGALSANCTVTIPAVARIGWVSNATTGGFSVILTCGGTTNLTVPPGDAFLYTCDGVSLVAAVPVTNPGLVASLAAHGIQSVTASANFTVPAAVTMLDVELWAGGSGSWASRSGLPGGGGSGGGYARKRIMGVVPAAVIAVTIGAGGTAGTTSVAPTAGGISSFGGYCSAAGGALNPLNTVAAPTFGNIAGTGVGGDLNLFGGDGGLGVGNQGGLVFNQGGYGGGGPLTGGFINSGNAGNPGRFPGGGASGAGTGATGTTAYSGAAGAAGLCIVRW
jgi:hypothetical protein